jgi:glutathione S-transferase
LINNGPWDSKIPEISTPAAKENGAQFEALGRVVKHHPNIIKVNQEGTEPETDVCMRAALTTMITSTGMADQAGSLPTPATVELPSDGDAILRYIRDRICVPRDMSLHAARAFRKALEETASMVGNGQGKQLGLRDRRDQDPRPFRRAAI